VSGSRRAPTPPESERLYSIAEVARLWAVSRDHVERLLAKDELRHVRVGALRRIPASALDEYVVAHS